MIPEPDTFLWVELRKFFDTNIWPAVDEDAAQRMGDAWQELAAAMLATIEQAEGANNILPGVWRDVPGVIYQRNIGRMLGPDGYRSAVASLQDMAKLCYDLARQVAYVKDQIWSELILNALYFAGTFALPPGIGDFLRYRILAGLAVRFSALIRAAAGLIEHSGSLVSRTLAGFLTEGIEGAAADSIGQALDRARGFREGQNWDQTLQSAAAEVLGAGLSRGIAPVGLIGSVPGARLADALRLGDRGTTVLQQSGSAFVVNGITSPVAGTAVHAIAEGKFFEVGLGDYLSAIGNQGLLAGALGASRTPSVQAGDALGQRWINAVNGPPNSSAGSPNLPQITDPSGLQPPVLVDPGGATEVTGPQGPQVGPGAGVEGPTRPPVGAAVGQGSTSGATDTGGTPAGGAPAGAGGVSQGTGQTGGSTANSAAGATQSPNSVDTTNTNSAAGRPGGLPPAASQDAGTIRPGNASSAAQQNVDTADQQTSGQQTTGEGTVAPQDTGLQPDAANQQTTSAASTDQHTTAAAATDQHAGSQQPGDHRPIDQQTSNESIDAQGNETAVAAPPVAASVSPVTTQVGPTSSTPVAATTSTAPSQNIAPSHSAVGPQAPASATQTGTTQTGTTQAAQAPTGPASARPGSRSGTTSSDEHESTPAEADSPASTEPQPATATDEQSSEHTIDPSGGEQSAAAQQNEIHAGAVAAMAAGSVAAASQSADVDGHRNAPTRTPAHTSSAAPTRAADGSASAASSTAAAAPVTSVADVVVGVAAVEVAGSVEVAAQRELVARMNERGADGRLTEAAAELRWRFYSAGTEGNLATGVLGRRALDDVPGDERTFTVAVESGEIAVGLPWVSQDKAGVMSLAAVAEGRKVGKVQVAFSDPVLKVTETVMESFQRLVNGWRAHFDQSQAPVPVRITEGERAAWADVTPQERARIEAATRGPNPVETVFTDHVGGELGEGFAGPIVNWLAARYPGEKIYRVYLELDGAGTFDQIHVRIHPTGDILGFVIVEAKNPNADLNTRLGVDGATRYAQGHREYVRSILKAMMALDRDERAAVLDTTRLVEVSAADYADAYATRTATNQARAAEDERLKLGRADVKPAKQAAKAASMSKEDVNAAGKAALDAHRPAADAAYAAAYQAAFAAFEAGDSVGVAAVAADHAAALTEEADAAVARAAADPADVVAGKKASDAVAEAAAARVTAATAPAAVAYSADPNAAYDAAYADAYATAHAAHVAEGGPWARKVTTRPDTKPELKSSFDVGEAMTRSFDDGTLEYLAVRAEVDGSTGVVRPKGIAITEYAMNPDPGTGTTGQAPTTQLPAGGPTGGPVVGLVLGAGQLLGPGGVNHATWLSRVPGRPGELVLDVAEVHPQHEGPSLPFGWAFPGGSVDGLLPQGVPVSDAELFYLGQQLRSLVERGHHLVVRFHAVADGSPAGYGLQVDVTVTNESLGRVVTLRGRSAAELTEELATRSFPAGHAAGAETGGQLGVDRSATVPIATDATSIDTAPPVEGQGVPAHAGSFVFGSNELEWAPGRVVLRLSEFVGTLLGSTDLNQLLPSTDWQGRVARSLLQSEFARLIQVGHRLTVVFTTVESSEGRPASVRVVVEVTHAEIEQSTVYRAQSVGEMVDTLAAHTIRRPATVRPGPIAPAAAETVAPPGSENPTAPVRRGSAAPLAFRQADRAAGVAAEQSAQQSDQITARLSDQAATRSDNQTAARQGDQSTTRQDDQQPASIEPLGGKGADGNNKNLRAVARAIYGAAAVVRLTANWEAVEAAIAAAMGRPEVLAAAGLASIDKLSDGVYYVVPAPVVGPDGVVVQVRGFRVFTKAGTLDSKSRGVLVTLRNQHRAAVLTVNARIASSGVERTVVNLLSQAVEIAAAVDTPGRSLTENRALVLDSDPLSDVDLAPADRGELAELNVLDRRRQATGWYRLLRRSVLRTEIHTMLEHLALANGQRDAGARRNLLTGDSKRLADRVADGWRTGDLLLSHRAFMAKAMTLGGPATIAAGIGIGITTDGPVAAGVLAAASWVAPLLTATIVGSPLSRWVARASDIARGKILGEMLARLEAHEPGLESLLGKSVAAPAEVAREDFGKNPLVAGWHKYMVRRLVPSAAGAWVAVALAGPEASAAMLTLLAGTAVLGPAFDRYLDARRNAAELRRYHDDQYAELTNPERFQNKLAADIAALRQRMRIATGALAQQADTVEQAEPSAERAASAGFGTFSRFELGDALPGFVRRFVPGTEDPLDPSWLAQQLNAYAENVLFGLTAGPVALVAAVVGSSRQHADDLAEDGFIRAHLERAHLVESAELMKAVRAGLADVEQAVRRIEMLAAEAGRPPETTRWPGRALDRLMGRTPTLPATTPEVASELPQVPAPDAQRPNAWPAWKTFAVHLATPAAAIAAVLGMDAAVGLPPSLVAATVASASVQLVVGPVARFLFRRAEMSRAVHIIDAVSYQVPGPRGTAATIAVAEFITTQLQRDARAAAELVNPAPATPVRSGIHGALRVADAFLSVRPSSANFTARVRGAVAQAHLANVPRAGANPVRGLGRRQDMNAALVQIEQLAGRVDDLAAVYRLRDAASRRALSQARLDLVRAITAYSQLTDGEGRPAVLPDLAKVEPMARKIVSGSYTDRVRAAVQEGTQQLHAEQDSPLRDRRVSRLDRISRLADAADLLARMADVNAEPLAGVRNQLRRAIESYQLLQRRAGAVMGFPIDPSGAKTAGQEHVPLPTHQQSGTPSTEPGPVATSVPALESGGQASNPSRARTTDADEVRPVQPLPNRPLGQEGAVDGGPARTPDGRRLARLFGGNEVTRPAGEPVVGQQVVARLRALISDQSAEVMERLAELAQRQGRPVQDGRPVGWRFFGNSGVGALFESTADVDLRAFAALEEQFAELIRTGHEVTLTITRVGRPSPSASPYRFTVEVAPADGKASTYTARTLADLRQHLAGTTDSEARNVPIRRTDGNGPTDPGPTDPDPTDPTDPTGPRGPVGPIGPQGPGGPQRGPESGPAASEQMTDAGSQPTVELDTSGPEATTAEVSTVPERVADENVAERRRRESFLPGWIMVSELSGRLLPTLIGAVTGIAEIIDQGNGVYQVETVDGDSFRLIKRVGPFDSDVQLEYTIQLGADPVVELTLSDRLLQDDIGPLLARVLAETRAEVRFGEIVGEKVFRPDGDPAHDAVLRSVDTGDRAELHYRSEAHDRAPRTEPGRRAAVRTELAKLISAMGVGESQPNTKILRSLLTDSEQSLVERFKDRVAATDDRVGRSSYLAKAAKSSSWSGLLIGIAATVFTGNPLVGIGIAVPTVVNSLIGALTERHLDAQKEVGKKPAYDADRSVRKQDYPRLKVFLDGEQPAPRPPVKPPRATAQRNYLVRHAIPTLATAAVAGMLTVVGVPALPTALVIASSALAKSLAERIVDKRKFDFRLARVDATARGQLSDPASFENQLVGELAGLRSRLDQALSRVIGLDTTRPEPAIAPHDASNTPGTPPLPVHLAAQAIDNVSSAARRVAFSNNTGVDNDPTELAKHVSLEIEGLLNAIGPAIFGGVFGALGDRFFMNREEAASDAQKNWDEAEREARQAAALAGALRERFGEIEQLVEQVEQAVGVPMQAARQADRAGFPASPPAPEGVRPGGQSPRTIYAAQVAAAAIGGAVGVIGLDLVFDLPDLGVVLTLAGVAGAMTGTPYARYAFRRAELDRKDQLTDILAKQAVDRSRLVEQVAVGKYGFEQVRIRVRRVLELSSPSETVQRAVTEAEFTDRVRAAVRTALLDNLPDTALSERDLDVLRERIRALERIDRVAADLDWSEAIGAPEDVLATDRARLRQAIALYERIADGVGQRLSMPDLESVDPSLGQRVLGGRTEQLRAAAEEVLRSLIAEPAGKKLLLERVVALEVLTRASEAVDHHAVHGTAASQLLVTQQLEDHLEAVHALWRQAGAPDGITVPALSTPAGLSKVGGEVVVQVAMPGSLEANHVPGATLFPATAAPDRAALSRLEEVWSDLVRRGYEVTVTIRRVARPTADADPFRFTVEISDPTMPADPDRYGPAAAAELVPDLEPLATTGRHHAPEQGSQAPPATEPAEAPTVPLPVPPTAPATTVAEVLGAAAVEVIPGALPLQDGGFRVTLPDGRQVVLPGSVMEALVTRLGGVESAVLRAEATRLLTEELAKLATQASPTAPAPVAPEDVLRAAARRLAAEDLVRQAQRLAPTTPAGTPHSDQATAPTATGPTETEPVTTPIVRAATESDPSTTPIQPATDPPTQPINPGSSAEGEGGTVHAPEVSGTGFVANGRPEGMAELTIAEALDAVAEIRVEDFGGGVLTAPRVVDEGHVRDAEVLQLLGGLVEVETNELGTQHFRVGVGPVRANRVAATRIGRGTAAEPHLVRFAPGLAADQLARAWVHEISHTLQDLMAPAPGVVRRLWTRLTGRGENACVDAQFNEFRLLSRAWVEAAEQAALSNDPADVARERTLREDIGGLLKAIERRGHTPPTAPWYAGTVPISAVSPLARFTADVVNQVRALTDAASALQARIDARLASAADADQAVQKAQQDETTAAAAKDGGRHARVRQAQNEARKQSDLAKWHRELAANYQGVLDRVDHARLGYEQLLATATTAAPAADSTTPLGATISLTAQAEALAREMAEYEQTMAAVSPSPIAVTSLMPTGRLPQLTALAERINDVMVAQGIDERVTAGRLQHRLSAEFGRLASDQGVVLRFGRSRPGDVRIRLTATELIEVLNPPVRASETMIGLLPQGGRRLATAQNGWLGTAGGLSLGTLTRVFGDTSWAHALGEFVNLRVATGTGRSHGLTANAAEFAQDGAVEDNRGESVLFSGKASWQLEVRRTGEDHWTPAGEVANSNQELSGWISHAYTVPAPVQLIQRADLATDPPGPLPAHVPVSISGLQNLSDQVVVTFSGQLGRLGKGAALLVRDQIQAALTEDLPGRLSESTEQAVVRPLVAGGKAVGHLQVQTKVRYEEVELVGAPSRTHWQERVRVGFSTVSGQQSFGASATVSGTVGYGGDQLTDLNDSGVSLGPSSGAGRSVSRTESMSASGTAIQVGVQRFTGPTQGYRMVLDHEVTLVLGNQPAGSVSGQSEALLRLHANDAYRHGLPVDVSTLVLDDQGRPVVENGRPVLAGDVRTGVTVPGRRLDLPEWAGIGAGQVRGSGPWMVQGVTGGTQALQAIIAHLADRGFVPVLDATGNPDLNALSEDPLERHAQLLNLAELRAQLSTSRLEAGYDIAAQTGIVVTLNHPRTGQPTDTVTLRIALEQGAAKPLGVSTEEAMVTLNIGSDTAGRSGGRSKAMPWRFSPLGLSSDTDGLGAKAGLSYGRQALGRVTGWFTGGTVNQVTLVESTSPVAVFEIPHRLVVTELTATGPQPVHQGSPGTAARVVIDSDLLPYSDLTSGAGLTAPGPVADQVLDRATILALDTHDLLNWLPTALGSEPTVRQQLAAFLNPRNLIAHPEWAQSTYRTAAVLRGWGAASRRSTVSLRGKIRDAELVAVADGVSGDINLALSNHGTYAGTSTGSTTNLSASASEDSNGGGVNGSLGRNALRAQSDQAIWGVERLTIEVGRHYVFAAAVDFDLAVGNQGPTRSESATVFQLAERDALRFFGRGELGLPLHHVADAVERYLNGNLELDRGTATALVRSYRAALVEAATRGMVVPDLATGHTAEVLLAKLRIPSPRPLPQDPEARLEEVLTQVEKLAATRNVNLPPQYGKHLGSSLVETVALTDAEGDVRLIDRVKSLLGELGVPADQDPVLAESLFADLAGKRWWGRLDDMLAPEGFSRSYLVGPAGRLAAQRVSVRVRAVFTDETESLGRTRDTISIVQRYLYGEQARTASGGQTAGIGLEGSIDAGHGGNLATDRSSGVSTLETEQFTRLERMATFDGLNRVRRGMRFTVEVVHEPASGGPTRGRFAQGAGADVAVRATSDLDGSLVQLIPGALTKSLPTATSGSTGPVVLPGAYFVESASLGESQLLGAVRQELARRELLNDAGVKQHATALEAVFSAAARDAAFSRMAADGGYRVVRLEVPGHASQFVDVTVQARVSDVELVGGPAQDVEIGEVNRVQHTVAMTTTTGRMLPVTSGGSLSDSDLDTSASVSTGDQLSDSVTDVRGARRERSRFEKGEVVTIRVRVSYDVGLTRTRVTRTGAERELTQRHLPTATTGEAYLTVFRHEYDAMLAALPARSPAPAPPSGAEVQGQAGVSGWASGGPSVVAFGYQEALRRARVLAREMMEKAEQERGRS